MPPMIFPGRCGACGKDVRFIEFKAEPCTDDSDFAREYAFRCMACRAHHAEVQDAAGTLHRWVEGAHVTSPA